MSRKRAATTFAWVSLACAALPAAGCGGSQTGDYGGSHPGYGALRGAPPRLAALYRQHDALLPGGGDAFQRRLAALRGHPAVVNVWASWCGPCREEFPWLQRLAARRGRRVAFLGVNSADSEGSARDFLAEYPLPYPSYSDPDRDIARGLGALGFPATAFYDASGQMTHLNQGGYANQQALARDIRRYAAGAR